MFSKRRPRIIHLNRPPHLDHVGQVICVVLHPHSRQPPQGDDTSTLHLGGAFEIGPVAAQRASAMLAGVALRQFSQRRLNRLRIVITLARQSRTVNIGNEGAYSAKIRPSRGS